MKRFVAALAMLLAFVGLTRADYVIIIYNLSPTNPQQGGNGQRGGFPGMGGMPGGMGGMMPGGARGGMPGGAVGIGGGAPGGAGGFPGGAGGFPGGMGGGVPPGGAVGIGGGVPGGMGGVVPPGGAGGVVPPGGAGGVVPGGAGGFPGGMGGNVPPGGAIGVGGGVPGGMGGVPGGMGGGSRPGGFGGSGSGAPPSGFGGSGSGGPPAGGGTSGSIPQPGNFGGSGSGGPSGGFGGSGSGGPPAGGTSGGIPQPGGFGGSGSGAPGGFGGSGSGAFAGGLGGFLPGGMAGRTPAPSYTPLWATAVIEVERPGYPYGPRSAVMTVHTKWSGNAASHIIGQSSDKHMTALYVKSLTVKQRYATEHNKAFPNGKADPAQLPKLAEWTLRYGMLNEFVETMNKWAELEPNNDKVKAFLQVQKQIATPITKPDPTGGWRDGALNGYRTKPSDHYVLLHNIDAANPADVEGRLKRLEDNYRSFFYWFAMKGKVLNVPDQRMVAVLVKRGEEFKRQQQIFDSLAGDSDGFLARRENLAIFSLERTDSASEALTKSTQALWRDLLTDRDSVLSTWPRVPYANTKKGLPVPLAQGCEIQTVALLERALQEDAEIAAVTHEGTRQLLAATGQLPRNVAVPHWLQFGWGSFFETPKGSPWMTVGAPSSTILSDYNYLEQFKAARKAGKLGTQKANALIAVVTDQNFRDYIKMPKNNDARDKAHTMAWSLVFYLAQERLDGLIRYHEELKKLPRDLEFDSRTLLLTFARSFDCLDAARPTEVDMTKLESLANHWDDYVNLTQSEKEALVAELIKAQSELKTKQAPKADEKPTTTP